MTRSRPNQINDKRLKGWLWRRVTPNSWEKTFGATSSKRISFFKDDKEDELVEIFPLAKFTMSEVTFHDVFQSGSGKRHTKGILLRPNASEDLDTDAEKLLNGSLPTRQEILLAGEDAQQHSSWLRQLSKGCANRAALSEDGSESKAFRPYSTGIRSPPQAVVQRLCGPGLARGRQLLERLRITRWQLEAAVRDLSNVREEARAAQRPINDLHGILLDMSQALDVYHGDLSKAEDLLALRLCQDWLQNAITFVMEVDHQINQLVYSQQGTMVASEWLPLAQNTILQLRDIEDAMRAEELRQLVLQRQQQQQQGGAGAGILARKQCGGSAAMGYHRWWAEKVAL